MLAGKQCCFGETECRTQMKPGGRGGGQNWTRQLFAQNGGGGLKRREEEAVCVVQSPELHW